MHQCMVDKVRDACRQRGRMGERGERTETKEGEVGRGVGGRGRERENDGEGGVTENGVLRRLVFLTNIFF